MKLFTFEFDGIYLGGAAVVLADNETEARKIIRDVTGKDLKMNSMSVDSCEGPGLIYFDDGDY